MSAIRKSSYTKHDRYDGRHRFEHWYRDNQIYSITVRCSDRFHAFTIEPAKMIFWDRFNQYTSLHGFAPFITTLMANHYHTLGYLSVVVEVGEMMRKFHGSVAKLVNDVLPVRRKPFWHDRRHHDYFDGCIRDEKQFTRAYRYIATQATRSNIRPRDVHTQIHVELNDGLRFAVYRKALLRGVDYARYKRSRQGH